MKYDVLKDVVVMGALQKEGSTIDLNIPADRLVMLGYLVEHQAKPKRKSRKTETDDFELSSD